MRRLCIIVLSTVAGVAVLPLPAAHSGTGGAPDVVLLDTGAEPRELLRVTPTEGDTRVMALTMSQRIEQSGISSISLGPLDMRVLTTATIGAVSGDTFPVDFAYSDAEVLASSEGTAAELDALSSSLQVVEDLSGTYTMTTSGAIVESQFDAPSSLDPTLESLLDQFSNQADQLAVPFPDEPVGVGARWRSVSDIDLLGISVRQKYFYTLRSRDGTVVELDIRFVQTAPRGDADLPGVPSNVDVTIEKFKTKGSGTVTLDLGWPFPVASTLDASGEQRFRADDGKESGTLVQRLEIGVEFGPADQAE